MGRKRRSTTQAKRTKIGWTIDTGIYRAVKATCRSHKKRWIYGHFVEAALRHLLGYSPLVQRELVENIDDPEFWKDVYDGIRAEEPVLLQRLSKRRQKGC